MPAALVRCAWPGDDALMTRYHDEEWGVPLHDDRKLFEFIVLDAAQAGLSWRTVLRKRANYERLFDGFDVGKIARYTPARIAKILLDPGIIRNRLKVESVPKNAKAFLAVQKEFGSFDAFIWQFVQGKTVKNAWTALTQLPARTAISDAMSKELKKRGFSFVGSTICYAFMQAAGMVNDHVAVCFRHKQVGRAK